MLKLGLLTKEEDATVEDRRYRTHYYIHQTLGQLLERTTADGLVNYAQEKKGSEILNRWVQAWETVPLILNQLTTRLMLSQRHPINNGNQEACHKVTKIIGFHVAEKGQFDGLDIRLTEFIQDLQVHLSKVKRNWKEPLRHPMAIALSVVTLNPDEICDARCQFELIKDSNNQATSQ
ncbi:MAG: hypothetical protein ACFE9D_09580 [Promethearchaeota archaeon]